MARVNVSRRVLSRLEQSAGLAVPAGDDSAFLTDIACVPGARVLGLQPLDLFQVVCIGLGALRIPRLAASPLSFTAVRPGATGSLARKEDRDELVDL
jgi:hypothetical protein